MRLFIISIACLFLSACSDEPFTVHHGQIRSIIGPDTVKVDQPIEFMVEFNGGTNGCATAHKIKTDKRGVNTVVTAYYKTPNGEPTCTMVVPVHSLPLSASYSAPGLYTLMADSGGVTHEIVVVK